MPLADGHILMLKCLLQHETTGTVCSHHMAPIPHCKLNRSRLLVEKRFLTCALASGVPIFFGKWESFPPLNSLSWETATFHAPIWDSSRVLLILFQTSWHVAKICSNGCMADKVGALTLWQRDPQNLDKQNKQNKKWKWDGRRYMVLSLISSLRFEHSDGRSEAYGHSEVST